MAGKTEMTPKPIMITKAFEAVLVSCRDLIVEGEIGFDPKSGCWPLAIVGAVATGWDGEARKIELDDEDKESLAEMSPTPLIVNQLQDTGLSPEKDRIEVRFSIPGGPLITRGSN
jgi:hypothetical protein